MKKGLLLFVLMTILLTACAKTEESLPYNQLPDDYSLENAKSDDCVVFENLDITAGQSVWEKFITSTTNGKPSTVRLAFYYTLNNPSHYSAEYYEEIKDDYPALYIMDLSYDSNKYMLYYKADEQEYTKEFSYLVKYTGKPRSSSAVFSEYVYYVLVNDNSVTWEDIEDGMFSSQSDAWIDHYKVYSDLIFD